MKMMMRVILMKSKGTPLDSLHAGKGGFLHVSKTISLLHYHSVNSCCHFPLLSSQVPSFIISFFLVQLSNAT